MTNFETYYTIPNVNLSNNKFYFDNEVVIPEGSYGSYDRTNIEKHLKYAILHSRPNNIAKKKVFRKELEDDKY